MTSENFFDRINRGYSTSQQPEITSDTYTPRQLKQYLEEQRSRASQDLEQPLLKRGKGYIYEILEKMTGKKRTQLTNIFNDNDSKVDREKVAAFLANHQLLVNECIRKGISVEDLPLEKMIVLPNGSIDFQGIIYGPKLSG